MGKADIWLIRTNWDFEYPRPFLPNFKFVGGLHCKPAKPLSKVRLLNTNVSTVLQDTETSQYIGLISLNHNEVDCVEFQAMEEFVQSSGDDGIVVFSLGSMIKNLTKERGNTIATALGQIPQKVSLLIFLNSFVTLL